MSGVISALIPLGAAVAVSPVPLLALVVVLLTAPSRGAGVGFFLGWTLGVTGAALLASTLSLRLPAPDNGASGSAAVAQIAVGVVLLLAAAGLGWSARSETGAAKLSGVARAVAAIGALTFVRAVPVGLSFSLNPKALAVAGAAGVQLASAPAQLAETLAAAAVYVVVAVSPVGILVIIDLYAGPRFAARLETARSWLLQHSRLLTATVIAALGLLLLARGTGGVTA